jgi:hypothetical protein
MTVSKDFPTTPGVFQPVHAGITTAFVAKLNADLTGMLFSTFLGGSRDERGQTLAIDSAGDIYVGGRTLSTDFPATPGAFQPQFVRGSYFGDGFVAKLAGDGSELIYATYLGGSSEDEIKGIAIDTTGEVIVVGGTGSPDFPVTADALQPSLRGLDDLFIARLSADGSELLYSTLFGGGKSDSAYAIATDGRGGAVVAGTSVSSDLPVTPGALQSQLLGATTGVFRRPFQPRASSMPPACCRARLLRAKSSRSSASNSPRRIPLSPS